MGNFRTIIIIILASPFFSVGQPPEDIGIEEPIPGSTEEDGGAIPEPDGEETPTADETNPNEYATKEYGIYFAAPEGWTLTKNPERGGLFEINDAEGEIAVRCYVKIIKLRVDIEEYIEKQEKSIGLFKRGKIVREMVKDEALPVEQRDILSSLLYDDYEKISNRRGSGLSLYRRNEESRFLYRYTTRFTCYLGVGVG